MRKYIIIKATEVILEDDSTVDDAWDWYKDCPDGFRNTIRVIDEKIVSNDYVPNP
jgi:hypothetical protein